MVTPFFSCFFSLSHTRRIPLTFLEPFVNNYMSFSNISHPIPHSPPSPLQKISRAFPPMPLYPLPPKRNSI